MDDDLSSEYMRAFQALEATVVAQAPPKHQQQPRSPSKTLSPPGVSSQSPSQQAAKLVEEQVPLHECRIDNPELELPVLMQASLRKHGITSLQASCLRGALQCSDNIVYSAPTSAGKTLVSEILMSKTVLKHRLKAIFAVPLVAVAEEKLHSLGRLYGEDYVSGYYRGHAGRYFSEDDECRVAVCTFEKASMLVNRLLEEGRVRVLGIVVVDEVHMVGDVSRGPVLESLLAKLLRVRAVHEHLRIVCMSATIGNMDIFESWLKARVTVSDWRPIPLQTYIVDQKGTVVNAHDAAQRGTVTPVPYKDYRALLGLCQDSMASADGLKKSTLVFCPTRASCVDMCRIFLNTLKLKKLETSEALTALLYELGELKSVLSENLAEFLPFGVAFHHAGLTSEERTLVERAFKLELVTILTATSTLAVGVNLPAERVIFRELYKSGGAHRINLTASEYRQMAGRAGRPGSDVGQVFVFCEDIKNQAEARALIEGPPDEMNSQLEQDLSRVILEACLVGLVNSGETLNCYLMETLWWYQVNNEFDRNNRIQAALGHLRMKAYMKPESIALSELGVAVAASFQKPSLAQEIFEDLKRARENGIILASDLHLVFLISPVPPRLTPFNNDWQSFSRLLNSNAGVLAHIGIEKSAFEYHVTKMNNGSSQHVKSLKRLWNAYILCDLISEVPVNEILKKYFAGEEVRHRAAIERLQEDAVVSASCALRMCVRLGWDVLAAAIEAFIPRLERGVFKELLPLFYVEGMTRTLARELFNNKYRTPQAICEAQPGALLAVLEQCPFLKFINNPIARQMALKKRVNQMQMSAVVALDREARQSPIQLPSQPPLTRSRNQAFYEFEEVDGHDQGMRLGNLLETWSQQKVWSWKSNIQNGQIRGIAVCWNLDEVVYINMSSGLAHAWLRQFFVDPKTTKVCLDMQRELALLPFEFAMTSMFDPRVAEALLCSFVRLDVKAPVLGSNSKRDAADDCRRSLKQYFTMRHHLDDHGLLGLFFNVEMPVLYIIAQMSRVGVPFDEDVGRVAAEQAQALRQRHLGDAKRLRTSRSRQLDAYLASLESCRYACTSQGRIHCTFDATRSSTGRITTREPNVQCVPHVRSIGAPVAREEAQDLSSEVEAVNEPAQQGVSEVTEALEVTLRSAFKARQGHVLISLDYCQMELCLAGYLSQDATLLEDLRGADIFESMARQLQMTRKRAKTMCYGLMYGMQPSSLAAQIGVSKEKARQMMQEFYRRYEGLRRWKMEVVKQASRETSEAYLETLGGKKALFRALRSKHPAEQEKAARAAVNWMTQGSCADILKRAMIRLHASLHSGALVMQVHDELLLECRAEVQLQCMSEAKEAMEGAIRDLHPELRLRVKCRVGPDWQHLQFFDIDAVLAALT